MKKFIELNHPLEDGLMAYLGLPRPEIGAFLEHKASRSRLISRTSLRRN